MAPAAEPAAAPTGPAGAGGATLAVDEAGGDLVLALAGRLDAAGAAALWAPAMAAAARARGRRLVVDATEVAYCDGAGTALLDELDERQRAADGRVEIRGLRPEFQTLLDLVRPLAEPERRDGPRIGPVARLGRLAVGAAASLREQVAFIGELVVNLALALRTPSRVRWSDAVRIAEAAGINALPIVVLMGFLIGLIMSFQSAIPMRRFGADLFVADLVSLSMLRELGPLMAAIMVAGRTGSAFAAELGTMRVNEEIDALTTMGLAPVRFLVVPRVLAGVLVMPLLAMVVNVAGLLGCLVVMVSLGYPPITFFNQMVGAVTFGDLLGGLFKAAVFGFLIASVGCLRGLQAGMGAAAVGTATTRSVVAGILLIILADGVFAVLFYYLDL